MIKHYFLRYFWVAILLPLNLSCQKVEPDNTNLKPSPTVIIAPQLNLQQAEQLAALPLNCISQPLPYKPGIVIADESDLSMPRIHHPAFYGCFDWHSAVHGHWSLVFLLKRFPQLSQRELIIERIDANLTAKNIAAEIAYFSMNKYSESFERTYGWAWLLKLTEELYTWDNPKGKKWHRALLPLSQLISEKYQDYLPKLAYPIRVGEHSNTAFGLSFALDYASTVGDQPLAKQIKKRARYFYLKDEQCPIHWEPSGYDFLSPCLQELDIMAKVLPKTDFQTWAKAFLPSLFEENFSLEPAIVKDRSDGKLVHLDGLNFSRAWCLYPVKNAAAQQTANRHLSFSLENITDGDYAGEHWLASFALYAFSRIPATK